MKSKFPVAALLLLAPGLASSQTLTPLNAQGAYYEIGGGDVVRAPLANSAGTPLLGMGADLRLSGAISCDAWDGLHLDLDAFVEMAEDHLDDAVNELQAAIVGSIIGAAQGAVTAALQRAMPGLYDWSMNVNAQIEADIDATKLSCQDTLNAINNGTNPLKGWIDKSVAYDWEARTAANVAAAAGEGEAPEGDNNILRVARNVATAKGERDIPWFDGVAGGASGEEINVISDSVVAGYQIQAGSNDLANGDGGAEQEIDYFEPGNADAIQRPQRLAQLWPSGNAAAQWVTEVVGEEVVSFCEECAPQSIPGRGLEPKVLEESNAVVQAWNALIDEHGANLRNATLAELDAVSSGRVRMTHAVMAALDGMHVQDRRAFMQRMSSDIGTSRAIEKALAARTLLKTALATHQVQGNVEARDAVETQLNRLTAEVESIVWEMEVGNKMASATPSQVIALHERKVSESAGKLAVPGSVKRGTTLMPDAPFVAE